METGGLLIIWEFISHTNACKNTTVISRNSDNRIFITTETIKD